jgi:tripartite-type tricarboxylate transporter receptor subunit TctC
LRTTDHCESGLPGFDGTSWFGLFAPRGTPPESSPDSCRCALKVSDNASFRRASSNRICRAHIIAPDVFARSINDGRERWGKIIRAAGLKK